MRADDPQLLVRAAARQARVTKERADDVLRILCQAAVTEPALAELWERIETEFRSVLADVAERLDVLGSLQPGLDVTSATDLMWALNHPDTWHLLVRRCGWTAGRYEQWVGETLAGQLLGVPRAAPPRLA